ncbi:MAG: phosphatidylglycerophosphatase B [Candidatus Roizmanbacteria bacterium GW2011_GWC2_37_13]|uniref:Phosphatidylglycerophosphatase B n=1 Tax=Candidatus Roizmanbacteria bacterium GW2011_GWC2_37_13 TaxID=1618486 RepID=A0A0G0JBH3_9BACT|nr:MAG: phosphatidylglycerophosphatase B [Candidatus Roizmanbacteria bacterium GW2011_GWC1_37_12]KKQ25536.1 MAG: phosphatidylglycerophosphatase B [Candidatus Roizmanbacteria bacterium GW2011_GWC2_37_13]
MKKKLLWVVISLLFLFAFAVFTFLVKEDILNNIDFDTTVRLQDNLPERFDSFLSSFSLIGSFEILAGLIFLVALLSRKIISFFVFIPFVGAHVIEIIGKAFVHHPGPSFMFFRYNLDFLFPSSYVQTGSSYPSGHSMRTVFVTFIFFYLIMKSKLKMPFKFLLIGLLVLFNGVMLVSRVSLGEHWTSDVVGGALLGTSAAFFSYLFL